MSRRRVLGGPRTGRMTRVQQLPLKADIRGGASSRLRGASKRSLPGYCRKACYPRARGWRCEAKYQRSAPLLAASPLGGRRSLEDAGRAPGTGHRPWAGRPDAPPASWLRASRPPSSPKGRGRDPRSRSPLPGRQARAAIEAVVGRGAGGGERGSGGREGSTLPSHPGAEGRGDGGRGPRRGGGREGGRQGKQWPEGAALSPNCI